jgi:hypothetical protein
MRGTKQKLVVVDLKRSNQVPKIYEAPYLPLLNREHLLARMNTEKAHKEVQEEPTAYCTTATICLK